MNYRLKIHNYLNLIVIISLLFSCKNSSSNEKIIRNQCDLKIDQLTLFFTKDSNDYTRTNNFNSVLYLRARLSIINNSKKTIYINFNNLFNSDYNYEIIGKLPGYGQFKFYTYAFMYNYGLVKNIPNIGPMSSASCNLETPVLELYLNKNQNQIMKFYEKLDSLKLYMKSKNDSIEIKFKPNFNKSLKQIAPPCIGKFENNELF